MPFKATTVWAYICVAQDGQEKFVGVADTDGSRFLMVFNNEGDAIMLRSAMQRVANESGVKITLARFDVRTDIEEIEPK